MKSTMAIRYFLMVALFVVLVAGQALADRPQTREIKDLFMWGDPDSPVESRDLDDGCQYQVAEPAGLPYIDHAASAGRRRCAAVVGCGGAFGLMGVLHPIECELLWRVGMCFSVWHSGE